MAANAPAAPDGLPLKKTMMLVNAFVINSTRFLNHFSALSEEKLAAVSASVGRLEKVLVMLETKLARLPVAAADTPGLPAVEAQPAATPAADTPALPAVEAPAANATAAASTPASDPAPAGSADPAAEEGAASQALVPAAEPDPADRPEYAQYRTMLKYGLHEGAVAQKMKMDGYNPEDLGLMGY